jgi:hypothetical protein
MNVCIFTGPTLSAVEGRRLLDAEFLPPVAQGDVYRAAQQRPRAIGIIDGYFEQVPSVWHKEILWAMSRGIHVFGCASMGALRAAELQPFGMVGIGRIFEAFRDGELEDDDEVAVAHGTDADGFTPYSEALVNIRATLLAAELGGIIRAPVRRALLDAAKATFYADRTYPFLLRRGDEDGLPPTELASLRAWLARERVNQKRQDALDMLETMRQLLSQDPAPKRVRYYFEPTVFWDRACRTAGEVVGETDRSTAVDEEQVLDELRLNGTRYRDVWLKTLARVLAADEARRQGAPPDGDTVQRSADSFRRARELLTSQEIEAWLRENGLTQESFTALAEEEALLRLTASSLAPRVAARMTDALRSSGEFTPLVERARRKELLLADYGLADLTLEDTGLSGTALLRWYVDQCLADGKAGAGTGAEELGRRAGFADVDAFRRAVIREFCYRRQVDRAASSTAGAEEEQKWQSQ